jgi:hypothetical protein
VIHLSHCITVIGLSLFLVGCKKAEVSSEPKAPPPKAVGVDVSDSAPPPPSQGGTAATPDNTAGTTTATDPAAPPPPPDEPLATSEEIAKFNPPEPMNAYAKRGPGDYQAQLDLYNKVLRTWASRADTPATFKDLMATYNSPKPPEPPAGRRLVYDRKTISVRLE